jgi:hypothetical protein
MPASLLEQVVLGAIFLEKDSIIPQWHVIQPHTVQSGLYPLQMDHR